MPVKPVSSLPEFKSSISSEGLTVVDFYATWCPPCKAIAPILEKLSDQYTQANFIKIDVDESADIAQEYGISAMPTFFFFKDGEKIGEVIGADPSKIMALITSNA